MKPNKTITNLKSMVKPLFFIAALLAVGTVYADDIGTVATKMTTSISKLAALIGVGSYVAGLGFAIGAIMKFKQHKDNPTQIPIGTPVALVFIAAALLFLPSVMDTIGSSMFSSYEVAGTSGDWGNVAGK